MVIEMVWRWWGLGASSPWCGRDRVCWPLGWIFNLFQILCNQIRWLLGGFHAPNTFLKPQTTAQKKPHSNWIQNGPFRAIFMRCVGDMVARITNQNMLCPIAMRKKLPNAITSSYGVWLRSSNSKNHNFRRDLQLSCYRYFHVSLSWTPKVPCKLRPTSPAPVIPTICS